MKQVLSEIMRHTAPLFPKIRVTGTDTGGKIEGHTDNKMLFLIAELKQPVPEFAGEFGIGNLSLLNGLLQFPSYKAEDAKFVVHRAERDGTEYVSEFEFRDAHGGHSRFRTMNPKLVADQARIATIPWDVTVTPSKAKLTEVVQLAGVLSEIDKHFTVQIEDGTLYLTIGGKGAASHAASVPLATEVTETLPASNTVFEAPLFLSVIKTAGNDPISIRFTSRGLCGITVETEKANYSYILRATEG